MLQLRGSGNDRHGTFVVFGVCRPDNGRLAFTKRYTSGGNNSVQYSGSIAASHDGRRPLGYELSGSWVLSGVTDRFLVWPTHSLGSVPPPADVASLQPEAWATQYVNSGGGAPVPVAAGDLLNFTGHFFERGQTTPMNFQAQWSSPYSQPGQPQYPQQPQPQHSTLKVSGVGVDSQMFTMEGVLQLSNGRIALVKRYLNSQSVFHYSGTVTSSPQRPLGFEIAGTWQGSRAGTFQLFPSSVSSSTNMPATQPLGASEQQFIEEWTAAHHPGAPVTVPTDSWLYMNGNYVDNNQLLNLSLKLRFEVLSRVRRTEPSNHVHSQYRGQIIYLETAHFHNHFLSVFDGPPGWGGVNSHGIPRNTMVSQSKCKWRVSEQEYDGFVTLESMQWPNHYLSTRNQSSNASLSARFTNRPDSSQDLHFVFVQVSPGVIKICPHNNTSQCVCLRPSSNVAIETESVLLEPEQGSLTQWMVSRPTPIKDGWEVVGRITNLTSLKVKLSYKLVQGIVTETTVSETNSVEAASSIELELTKALRLGADFSHKHIWETHTITAANAKNTQEMVVEVQPGGSIEVAQLVAHYGPATVYSRWEARPGRMVRP